MPRRLYSIRVRRSCLLCALVVFVAVLSSCGGVGKTQVFADDNHADTDSSGDSLSRANVSGPAGPAAPAVAVVKARPSSVASSPFAKARAIARFDVVPYQSFSDTFQVGVVAFHISGVERVEFKYETKAGQKTVPVTEMSLNSRTGVWEYCTSLRASDFADGPVTVKASVYPVSGLTRELSLELYANGSGSLSGNGVLYVSLNGSDAGGNGSQSKPFGSIKKALMTASTKLDEYDGGTIVLMDAGSYDIDQPGWHVKNDRWITIRSRDGLNRNDVVIAPAVRELVRPTTRRLRFWGLSLDFSKIGQMYKEDSHWQWYDNCRWYQSDGWAVEYPSQTVAVRNVSNNGLYITDSIAQDMRYAFTGANIVRGSRCEKISGDVFQNSLLIVNCTVDKIDGSALASHHTDVFQWWGPTENVITYGVKVTNVIGCQNFFFDHYRASFANCAFVNIAIQNYQDRRTAPFTQYNVGHEHVLFMHISNPGQISIFRDDSARPYTASNVKFVNCVMESLLRAERRSTGLPVGVTVDSCHFIQGRLHGNNPTAGFVSIEDGPGSSFSYAGGAASDIVGTGQRIPGFGHPNDGTSKSGAPCRGAFPFGLK